MPEFTVTRIQWTTVEAASEDDAMDLALESVEWETSKIEASPS